MTAKDYGTMSYKDLVVVRERLLTAMRNPRTANFDQVAGWYEDVNDAIYTLLLTTPPAPRPTLVSEVRSGWKSAA